MSSGRTERSDGFRFDVVVAVIGLVVALALLPLQLVVSHLYVLGIPIALGIGSTLYLLSARGGRGERLARLPGWASRLLPSVCLLGMAGLVTLAALEGRRTTTFYHLAIGVGILVFYQILFTSERDFSPPVVLGQVLLFAFVLRFAALYVTPGYVGIDVWTHVPSWTAGILETNSLEPVSARKYYAAPLFHLLVAASALFLDVSLQRALHLSVGIVVPLLTLLVYAAARLFVGARWSTFAAALFAMVGYTIEWSIHLIPTSLGLAFFTAIFYLLCRLLHLGIDDREFLLLVFLNVAVVLTHQISTFIVLVLVFSAILSYVLLSRTMSLIGDRYGTAALRRGSTGLVALFVFDLGFITFMWSLTPYHGRSFLETAFSFFYVTLTESEGFGDLASERAPEGAPPLESTFLEGVVSTIDAAGFLLLFLFAVVGGLFVLRRRNLSYASFMAAISIGIMFVFVFGFPMFGIRSFIPTRWYAFLVVPMIVLAAIGTGHLSRSLNPTVLVVVLVLFALVFPTVALVSSSATQDNPRFPAEQTRYSYTEAELAAVETVGETFPAAGVVGGDADADGVEPIRTDHPYQTVFERTGTHRADTIQLTDEMRDSDATVIHRDYQRDGAAYVRDEFDRPYTPDVSDGDVCGTHRSYVYDNGDVRTCMG